MPCILLYTEFCYPSRVCDCILTEIQIKGIEYSGEVTLLTIQHPNTLILSQFKAVYSLSYPGSLTGGRGTQPVFKEAKQAFYLHGLCSCTELAIYQCPSGHHLLLKIHPKCCNKTDFPDAQLLRIINKQKPRNTCKAITETSTFRST